MYYATAKYNGKRAKNSSLEKLECSKSSNQGQKSMVSQRSVRRDDNDDDDDDDDDDDGAMQAFIIITISDPHPEYLCHVLLTETFYRVCHFL